MLVSPTTPTVAFPLGARVDDPIAMYAADLCTLPASLAGVPAISVPCGLSEGLPVGFQIMAPALADDRCYRVAAALEAAQDAARGSRFLDQLPPPASRCGVSGALKAAWGLTAFVIVAGIVGWIVTGRPVFAVFIVLGVLTGAGGRRRLPHAPADRPRRRAPPREHRRTASSTTTRSSPATSR